ncbi:MAG: acyltransferase family protein [Candidatus Accumulibacter sp.]|uniref:acyltransferase family protein n=1 Tax=Accumulibacter sp. TaxID=2053492 RepID=UPI001A408110|nr:acyltransferase family protein [Accumulibacter sp.]MBL8396427.1 acyltransferase family protein [Accumulibacter sp.]
MTATDARRDHALDAARGALMALGIVIHAANVYIPAGTWLVADPARSAFFDWLASAIHSFRMPAFFWISGYFCALTLERYGTWTFLRKRLPRIAVPLLVSWGTLNVIQVIIIARLSGQDVRSALLSGVPIYHLWFLVDLLVYFSLAALLNCRVAQPIHWLSKRVLTVANPVLQLMLLAVFATGLELGVRATGLAYVNLMGLTSPFRLVGNFAFFFVGMLMYGSAAMRGSFFRIHPGLLVPAVLLCLWFDRLVNTESRLLGELAGLAATLMTWITVAAVIGLFRRLFAQAGRATRFMSDASYTIYLFHHVIVVLIAILLLAVPWSAYVKFPIVVLATFGLTAAIHRYCISPSDLLRFAFNGK